MVGGKSRSGAGAENSSGDQTSDEVQARSSGPLTAMLGIGVRVLELSLSAVFVYVALDPRTRTRSGMPGSRRSGPPISRVGRVILILLAGLMAVDGIRGLVHKPPLEFDVVHWRFVS